MPGCQEEARAAVEDVTRPRGRERINPKARGLNYSHSFTCVCSDANPVDSRLVVSLGHLATESRRVSSRRRLGQNVGQRRKLFAIEGPQFHFCLRDKNRQNYRLKQAGLQVADILAEGMDSPFQPLFTHFEEGIIASGFIPARFRRSEVICCDHD